MSTGNDIHTAKIWDVRLDVMHDNAPRFVLAIYDNREMMNGLIFLSL